MKVDYENSIFLLAAYFNIRWLWDAYRVPTWMDFGLKNPPKSALGRLLGRLVAVLGRLGRSKGFLKASWIVLEASWKRLGREKWPTWLQLGPKLAPKTEAKSVLGRPGGVLGASWRRHVADFMHF